MKSTEHSLPPDDSESGWKFALEENVFKGNEIRMLNYCKWLVSLSAEALARHYRCLNRLAMFARWGYEAEHGPLDSPECPCLLCKEWQQKALEGIAREAQKCSPRRAAQPKKLTYVYLMTDERTGMTKIGRSDNPKARESTLQSEKPLISLIWQHSVSPEVETRLHARFADKRIRGEWFNLTDEDIAWIKNDGVEACS